MGHCEPHCAVDPDFAFPFPDRRNRNEWACRIRELLGKPDACCSTLGQKRSLPQLQGNLNGSRRPHKVRPSPQARFSPSILRRAQSKAFDWIEPRLWRSEKRSWFGLQLRAMVYVVGCAIAMLAFTVLVILGPIFTAVAERHLPWLIRFVAIMDLGRLSVANILLATTLVAAHY